MGFGIKEFKKNTRHFLNKKQIPISVIKRLVWNAVFMLNDEYTTSHPLYERLRIKSTHDDITTDECYILGEWNNAV